MSARVIAVIPAYSRPEFLRNLLRSLVGQESLAGVVIVNNSGSSEIAAAAAGLPLVVHHESPGTNLGTAGGIAWGVSRALADAQVTHCWILDDDAEATPGALTALLDALEDEHADAAAPLLVNSAGRVEWLPAPLPRDIRAIAQNAPTVSEFRTMCAGRRSAWNWALWASLLISRRAAQELAPPRTDFWSQFSDIEYSLRLTARRRGVLVPDAVCRHLPPRGTGAMFDLKLASALQNAAFLALRLPQGRRFWRHLPGLYFRFLRHYRGSPHAWRTMLVAAWRGAVLGRLAGPDYHAVEFRRAEELLFRC